MAHNFRPAAVRISRGRNFYEENVMSNSTQNQNRPARNTPSSNQPNAGKGGNNVRKDEPTAQKNTGGMKDEARSTSGNKASESAAKSSKAS